MPNALQQGQASVQNSVTTDANGSFSIQMTIPQDAAVGTQLAVQVTVPNSGTSILSNTFTVTSPSNSTANVQITPSSGPAGTTLTVTGSGYPANTTVQVTLGLFTPQAQAQTLTPSANAISVTTDANGNFTTQVTIPTNAASGAQYAVQASVPNQNISDVSSVFVVTGQTGSTFNYTVVRGDTLGLIAQRYNTTISAILALNPQITNPNIIYPGQVLVIQPGSTGGIPSTGGTVSYTVQSGDTLASIAARYGTTVSAIVAANPNLISAGQVLTIPTGGTGGIPNTGGTISYTVVSGDSLGEIAQLYNTSIAAILALNPQITNENLIYPGQVLTIQPNNTSSVGTGGIPNTGASGTTYTVQPGDTMYSISQQFNTTVAALMAINPQVTNSALIYPGQVLVVR